MVKVSTNYNIDKKLVNIRYSLTILLSTHQIKRSDTEGATRGRGGSSCIRTGEEGYCGWENCTTATTEKEKNSHRTKGQWNTREKEEICGATRIDGRANIPSDC